MTEKSLEERIERLEKYAHEHKFFGGETIFGCVLMDDAERKENKEAIKREIERLQISLADIEKAKARGTVHGDPIIVIE